MLDRHGYTLRRMTRPAPYDAVRTPLGRRLLRTASVGLIALLAFGFWRNIGPIRPMGRPNSDVELNTRTIERIRAGEPYYDVIGDELRRGDYPTKPVFNWRTPLFYRTVAALSIERGGSLLTALSVTAIILGAMARGLFGGAMVTGAVLPAIFMRPAGIVLPEVMCGVLLTISLGLYYQTLWAAAAVVGLAALFVRELALPYAVLCACLAIAARRRRESLVWIAGTLLYVLYYAFHAHAAYQHIRPDDTVRQQSYFSWQGYTFVLSTIRVNGFLILMPPAVAALAPVAGFAGLAAPAISAQVALGVIVYTAAFCAAGQPFNFYWGFVTTGLWAYAFTYTPTGVRALVRAWSRHDSRDEPLSA